MKKFNVMRCPWCNSKAVIRSTTIGYYVECKRKGHVHNIGCFKNAKSFYKTDAEAVNEWNTNVENFINEDN